VLAEHTRTVTESTLFGVFSPNKTRTESRSVRATPIADDSCGGGVARLRRASDCYSPPPRPSPATLHPLSLRCEQPGRCQVSAQAGRPRAQAAAAADALCGDAAVDAPATAESDISELHAAGHWETTAFVAACPLKPRARRLPCLLGVIHRRGGQPRARRRRVFGWQQTLSGGMASPWRMMTVAAATAAAAVVVALMSAVVSPATASPADRIPPLGPPLKALPNITGQPSATVSATVGDDFFLYVLAKGPPPLAYEWQEQYVPGGPWFNADPGNAKQAPLYESYSTSCPPAGSDRFWVRAVVSNAAGAVTSRPTEVWLSTSSVFFSPKGGGAVALKASTVATLTWTAFASSRVVPDVQVFRLGRGDLRSVPEATSWSEGSEARRTVTLSWVPSEDGDGAVYYAVASTSCSGLRVPPFKTAESGRTRVSVSLGGLASVLTSPPRCPRGSRAVRGDMDGLALNNGNTESAPSCALCRLACVALPGCDVWVWGSGGGGRDRQCWLKKGKPVRDTRSPRVALKDAASAGRSVWVSGEVSPPAPCPGRWGWDHGGEVLVDGSVFKVDTCTACAAACAAWPGCNVWVFGAVTLGSDRHRQCWLKRSNNWASKQNWRWVSGRI